MITWPKQSPSLSFVLSIPFPFPIFVRSPPPFCLSHHLFSPPPHLLPSPHPPPHLCKTPLRSTSPLPSPLPPPPPPSPLSPAPASTSRLLLPATPGSTFLPHLSSSFAPFHCYDPSCRLVPHPYYFPATLVLASTPLAVGFFSRKTVTLNARFDHPACLPALPFGCAFNFSTSPSIGTACGILNLSHGPISFPSYTAPRFGATFSSYLPNHTSPLPPLATSSLAPPLAIATKTSPSPLSSPTPSLPPPTTSTSSPPPSMLPGSPSTPLSRP